MSTITDEEQYADIFRYFPEEKYYEHENAEGVIEKVCGAIGDAGEEDSCDETIKDMLADANELEDVGGNCPFFLIFMITQADSLCIR